MLHAEPHRGKVFVVDDDPAVLELITTRLSIAGYQTFAARDGQEAISRLSDIRPTAMVLDINMPRLDGFGVLREMRQMRMTSKVAVMVLTARNQSTDVQQAVTLGARDFLSKPFHDKQLLSRVARLLRPLPDDSGASKNPYYLI